MAKEVAKKDATNVVDLDKYRGAGTERLDKSAIKPPRLKLLQAMSPELMDNEDLRAGMFVNSVTEENFKEITLMPVILWTSFILWGDRDEGHGLLARADDGVHWDNPHVHYEHPKMKGVVWSTADTVRESGLANWGSSNPSDPQSKPAAREYFNVLCLNVDDLDGTPFILSFYSAALKYGHKFRDSIAAFSHKGPAWQRQFKLKAATDQRGDDKFFVPKLTADGYTTDDAKKFNAAAQLYEAAMKVGMDVDYDRPEGHEDKDY
jgi:hypothetical protein